MPSEEAWSLPAVSRAESGPPPMRGSGSRSRGSGMERSLWRTAVAGPTERGRGDGPADPACGCRCCGACGDVRGVPSEAVWLMWYVRRADDRTVDADAERWPREAAADDPDAAVVASSCCCGASSARGAAAAAVGPPPALSTLCSSMRLFSGPDSEDTASPAEDVASPWTDTALTSGVAWSVTDVSSEIAPTVPCPVPCCGDAVESDERLRRRRPAPRCAAPPPERWLGGTSEGAEMRGQLALVGRSENLPEPEPAATMRWREERRRLAASLERRSIGRTLAGERERVLLRGEGSGRSRGLSCVGWLAVAICMNDADETTLRSVRDSGVVAALGHFPCSSTVVQTSAWTSPRQRDDWRLGCLGVHRGLGAMDRPCPCEGSHPCREMDPRGFCVHQDNPQLAIVDQVSSPAPSWSLQRLVPASCLLHHVSLYTLREYLSTSTS